MNRNSLNSIIKFDLHIHSHKSAYKESVGIVEESTIENIDVLLQKLHEHEVALFSITDHNRFDTDLYRAFRDRLASTDFPYFRVKTLLAGVEFDVTLDSGSNKCHIIAIFDANNEELDHIEKVIESEKNILQSAKASYSRDRFENILSEIGLNTILIASQTTGLQNTEGKGNSLSGATDSLEVVLVSVIDALEYQKPKVEGILLNNLKALDLPKDISLVTGSDCHDWRCYPQHSQISAREGFYHSRAKMLPTFKGLLMAVTSPQTRFRFKSFSQDCPIREIMVGEQRVVLSPGVNAIIGENGAGKSTLLELMDCGDRGSKLAHVNKIERENQISISRNPSKSIRYIPQGDVVQKFNDEELYGSKESPYKKVDISGFTQAYKVYADDLYKAIVYNISKEERINSLGALKLEYESHSLEGSFYVEVHQIQNDESLTGEYREVHESIRRAREALSGKIASPFYKNYPEEKKRLLFILRQVEILRKRVETCLNETEFNDDIIGTINSLITDYELAVTQRRNSRDSDRSAYIKKTRNFVQQFTSIITMDLKDCVFPRSPSSLPGIAKNPIRGFAFNSEAAFNDRNMIEEFNRKMFTKQYRTLSKIRTVFTRDDLSKAVMNCSDPADIENAWRKNLERFLEESCTERRYMVDAMTGEIGNTLGEQALAYYKFIAFNNQEWQSLLVDQPEDHLSAPSVKNKMIPYLNNLREGRQIIFATHNPLLVVNLDVDNLIYVRREKGKIKLESGCLEYEDNDTNILDIVADHMDGGRETIERRLKVYGKGRQS